MFIKCTIQGQSPLLCNRFGEAEQAKVEKGTSFVARPKHGTPREQAQPKLYLSSEGRPVIPGPNVFSAIVDAGRFIKSGKSKLTTSKSSLVPAGVTVVEIEIPLAPAKWEVDSRAVVVPATGGRVMCHRPRFDEWGLAFTIDVDAEMFAQDTVRELVDIAGKRLGLGDFRPSRKGPFGRFKVTSWKIEK